MLRTDGSAAPTIAPPVSRGMRSDRMGEGVVASLLFHALAVAAICLVLWWPDETLPPVLIGPINLVVLGDVTAAPPSTEKAPVPQEKAASSEVSELPSPVPAAAAPPPETMRDPIEEHAAPTPLTAPAPTAKPPPPQPVRKPGVATAAVARSPPAPSDELSERLKRLGQLRQAPPVTPTPGRAEGAGSSNLAASSADAAPARDAAYRVKDFIRAQVERHWNLDGRTVSGHDWSVAIHLRLGPDGRVDGAEIVNDPRYVGNEAYQQFARSARNAVLLSSPLIVPPGDHAIAEDIVVDFSSRRALQ
jgi:outer membrane biosynthesis protein TonB